jgi:peptidoglycan/xylan/chitin deacetylase (PgdA/CDA1 family)
MGRGKLKTGTAHFLYRSGLYKFIASLHGTRNLPVLIGYHRVVENFEHSLKTSIPSMLVSKQMFESHLDWIGRRYRIVSLDEIGARLESGEEIPPKLAAITFDDGYSDFYENALPILQKKGVPAAVFVVTDLIGTSQAPAHDRLYLLLARRIGRRSLPAWKGMRVPNIAGLNAYHATRLLIETLPSAAIRSVLDILEQEDELSESVVKSFRVLDWEQLCNLKRSGITIGSHTRTHVILPNESPGRVKDELSGSRAALQQKLGGTFKHFVYPSGAFTMSAVEQVAEAGYKFGYIGCTHRSEQYPLLTLPRTVLWENSSLDSQRAFCGSVLSCQIHHAFNFAEPCRQRHEAVN